MVDAQLFDLIRNAANYAAMLAPLAATAEIDAAGQHAGKRANLPSRKTLLRALATLAAYVAISQLLSALDIRYGGYYLFLLSYIACGLFFIMASTRKSRSLSIMQLATAMSSVVLANGLVTPILVSEADGSAYTGASALLYGALMLAVDVGLAAFLICFAPRSTESVPRRYWAIITALPITYFAALQLQLIVGTSLGDASGISNPWSIASQLLTLAAILGTYFSAYLITTAYAEAEERRFMAQRLQLELDHAERSAQMMEQVRKDKHEMKNLFFYLRIMLDSGAYAELKDFVDDKIDNTYSLMEEFRSGNKLLDYLLTQKVAEARQLHIKTAVDLDVPAGLPVNDRDLCGVVANLLDNAIEATKDIPEEKRDIQVSIRARKGYLIIKVRNAVDRNVLRDNPDLATTKKDAVSHGIGTKLVRSIALRNQGTFTVSMEQGYFVAVVSMALAQQPGAAEDM